MECAIESRINLLLPLLKEMKCFIKVMALLTASELLYTTKFYLEKVFITDLKVF
jgi:hypothetical protein